MKALRLVTVFAFAVCMLGMIIVPDMTLAHTSSWVSSPVLASTVGLTTEAGFGGYIKPGTWIPVRITLTSSEPSDGEIALSPQPDRSRLYGTTVTLARAVRKQLTLYSPPTANPIEALFLNGGQVIVASTAAVHTLATEDRIILVVSEPADGLNFLNDLHTPFGGKSYVAQLRPDQIPDETAALDSADVLLLNNVDTLSLTDAQRTAIHAWVLGGGHLILGGGPGGRLTAGGFDDFSPAHVSTTIENSSVSNLNQLLAPNSVEATLHVSNSTTISTAVPQNGDLIAPVSVLQPATNDARSLVSSSDTPLIMRRVIGRGTVDQLAFDPTLAPLKDWPYRRLVFAGLFGGQLGQTSLIGPLGSDNTAISAARALPGAALPSFLVIAGYLLLYVLAIGPINFFILRKLNRLSWAWVTVPGTVLLFALIGYATGFRLRGNEPQVHRLSIVTGDAQLADARAQSIIGIFSPRRTTLDISVGHSLAEEVQPDPNLQDKLSFQLSDPNRLERVVATNNDVRAFYLRGSGTLPSIAADLQLIPGQTISDASRITGEIRNQTNTALSDCVLVAGKDYHVIGNIAPLARVPAEVKLQLNRPQLAMVIAPSRTGTASYSSTGGASYGRSATASTAVSSARSPFDMDGATLPEAVLNWRDFKDDSLVEQADRGLLATVFSAPDISLGNGVNLACWEGQDRIGTQVASASYTDRGLRIWRLPVRPFLAKSGTVLPPDVYSWSVLSSSSVVALDQNGLDMEPGSHIIALTPWLGTRTPGRADVTLTVGTSVDSMLSALRSSSVWMYDWDAQQFTQVITNVATTPVSVQASGAYVSTSGELRLRVDVQEDHIILTNIQTAIHIP